MKRNSDNRLRSEERAWLESGDDADAARFAASWIRAGKPEGELVVKLVQGGANLAVVSTITEIPGLDPDAPSDEVIRALWEVLKIEMLDYPDTEEDLVDGTGDVLEPVAELEDPITTVDGFIGWIDALDEIESGSTEIDSGRRDFTTQEGEWVNFDVRGETVLLPDDVVSPASLGLKVGDVLDMEELRQSDPDRAEEIEIALTHYCDDTARIRWIEIEKGWGATLTNDQYDWLAPFDTEEEAVDELFSHDETLTSDEIADKRKAAGQMRVKLLAQLGLAPPTPPAE